MATKRRTTKETDITASLNLIGSGKAKINVGIGYFEHMLESFAKHALIDLEIDCKGDLHVDSHHSVEDCGIVIGELLCECLYPLHSVERFGDACIVMDEACVQAALDLSHRPYFVYDVSTYGNIGSFDCELTEEFFKSLVFNAKINLHIIQHRGHNKHHIIEAVFKAFAVALRRALKPNERISIPSTKGVL